MPNRVDASELFGLADDFAKAPARFARAERKVVRRAAVNIKRGMRADLRAGITGSYLPDITNKINFDMRGPLAAEIGIDKVGQGHLGNFAAFGSIHNAPVFDHTASLAREEPALVDAAADAAADAVLGGPR